MHQRKRLLNKHLSMFELVYHASPKEINSQTAVTKSSLARLDFVRSKASFFELAGRGR